MNSHFCTCCILIFTVFFWSCKDDDIRIDEELSKQDSCANYMDSLHSGIKESRSSPLASLKSGRTAYGTIVYFYSDSLHSGSAIELSLDSGKTWTEKKCTEIAQTGEIQARYKNPSGVSVSTKLQFEIYYKRVLIIGNSITINGPIPEKGWMGYWGMAASEASKDYVHLISSRLKSLNPDVDILIRNYAEFERSYWWYNFNSVETMADYKPDLVIMRIAENTNKDNIANFQTQYSRFINTAIAKTSAKVICTNSFWKGFEDVDNIIKEVSLKNGYVYCDLSSLRKDTSYTAIKQYTDVSIGSHPSDKGMKAIADLLAKHF